ncbi:MAG: right-handed parallel beta-helix repeat-containing protein [Candidatus Hodarchaeota archaeon]
MGLENHEVEELPNMYLDLSTPHSSIVIFNDIELDAFCAGNGTNGTAGNPHIIENYEIDAGGVGSCIFIANTTRYLVIQGCTLNNSGIASDEGGIRLENASNIIIFNNTILDNSNGILVRNLSQNINISGNDVNASSGVGIACYNSSDNLIHNNTISNSAGIGMHFGYWCNNTDVDYNMVVDSTTHGILLSEGMNNKVRRNNVSSNYDGIQLNTSALYTRVFQNHVFNNSQFGIIVGDTASHNLIYANIIEGNEVSQGYGGGLTNNTWHYWNMGNYWGDFQTRYPTATSSWNILWNASYQVNTSSYYDMYPIVNKSYCSLTPRGIISISGDTALGNFPYKTGVGTPAEPYVIENFFINMNGGSVDGISISSTTKFLEIKNCVIMNNSVLNSGFVAIGAGNITLDSCVIAGVGMGIVIRFSANNNIITNCIVNQSKSYGVWLANTCDNNTIFGSVICNSTDYGIFIDDSAGIPDHCENNSFKNCQIYGTNDWGIYIRSGHNSTFENNTIYGNTQAGFYIQPIGSYLEHGHETNIISNNITLNGEYGIYATPEPSTPARSVNIIGNNISLHSTNIRIENMNDSIISYNVMKEPLSSNIYAINLDNTTFRGNTIEDSFSSGVTLMTDSDANNFTDNLIRNNTAWGLTIDGDCDNALVYNNSFVENTGPAQVACDSTTASFDNGSLGNYWSDYVGVDDNDDGIGDSNYTVYGGGNRVDRYPIWWDAPELNVTSPTSDEMFGVMPPAYQLSVNHSNNYTLWCIVSNATDNSPLTILPNITGTINQSAWDAVGNGTVWIVFYVNDSRGELDSINITLRKNIIDPSIDILLANNSLCSFTAPNVSVSMIPSGASINTSWYSIWNGSAWCLNYTFTGTWVEINQTEWDKLSNGTINMRFCFNDSTGFVAFDDLILQKDILGPFISIPGMNASSLFGWIAPNLSLSIFDGNFNSAWYSLDNGTTNYSTSQNGGQINQSAWMNTITNGSIVIRVYSNDTLSNVNYTSVMVCIDIENPVIEIKGPFSGWSGGESPIYDIVITEPNLDTIWYTLDGGQTNYTISSFGGRISEIAWDSCQNGIITLRFYVMDDAGNIGFEEVLIEKTSSSNNQLGLIFGILGAIGAISSALGFIYKITRDRANKKRVRSTRRDRKV